VDAFRLALTPETFGVDRAVFQSVMRDVVELRIRGEFVTVADEGGLDNVVLAEAAVDVKGTVTGVGKHKVTCTNARTGGDKVTVTISGRAE
jgi:hypothetical protein